MDSHHCLQFYVFNELIMEGCRDIGSTTKYVGYKMTLKFISLYKSICFSKASNALLFM